MPAVNVFLYLKKEETNRRTHHTLHELHDSVLNILKAFIIPEDLTVLLACLHLMRRNACTGNSLMLLHKRISLQYRVFFIDYGPVLPIYGGVHIEIMLPVSL